MTKAIFCFSSPYLQSQKCLSIPCRLGTPTYKLQVKTESRACIHAPPRALRYQTLPSCQGGLRGCHVSSGSGPCLPAGEGSGAAACHMAPDPASLPGGLRRCHTSSSSLWATRLKHKEKPCWHVYAARLACFQGTHACF
jgi:hypothetical protein